MWSGPPGLELAPEGRDELSGTRILGRDRGHLLGERQRALVLSALHGERRRRVRDVGIPRVELEGLEQGGFGLAVAAEPAEGERSACA